MTSKNNSTFLVRRLLGMDGAGRLVRRHRWYNEQDRWVELLGALLSVKLHVSNSILHPMLHQLRALDLLSISSWCKTAVDLEDVRDEEIVEQSLMVLHDYDLDKAQALEAVKVIHEAAHRIGERYKGKVQVALREAGEEILNALQRALKLHSLTEDESREALTLWLQNVLNVPIPLNRQSVERFCRAQGVTAAKLLEGADELDLNAAALDDLVESWDLREHRRRESKKA
jgi:hypothetical protein